MRLISREHYLEKLLEVSGTPDIKVITGIRRCGKSKLLESFATKILSCDQSANIIKINFNLIEFESLMEYHSLLEFVESKFNPEANNYLFIDEVQMCRGFERAINSLHATERYDIYITGSNAFLLSSDLATLFTGRTFELSIYPFSLKEFMAYYELEDLDEALRRYTLEGGMPGSYLYKAEAARYSYVSDVFETLILRDISQKYGVRNRDMLSRLADYLLDNISNVCSARSIANALKVGGINPSDKTIASYIDHLCNAFAFYKVRRYDTRGKRYLSSGEKLYLADHSIRYAVLGTKNMDYGRVYENMVAIELLRRGYEVYAGILYKKEIDFVAIKQSEKIYIQVCDNISANTTFERECAPLLRISDAYPKIIIANTHHETYTYEGIRIHDLARWLSGNGSFKFFIQP